MISIENEKDTVTGILEISHLPYSSKLNCVEFFIVWFQLFKFLLLICDFFFISLLKLIFEFRFSFQGFHSSCLHMLSEVVPLEDDVPIEDVVEVEVSSSSMRRGNRRRQPSARALLQEEGQAE